MADDKKKEVKSEVRTLEIVLAEIFGIGLVLFLIYKAIVGLKTLLDSWVINHLPADSVWRILYADPSWKTLERLSSSSWTISLFLHAITFGKVFAYLLSIFFVFVIVWLFRQISEMAAASAKALNAPAEEVEEGDIVQQRWAQVLLHSKSDNSSDWRLAILEADIMLDEFLDSKGYKGDTLSEKLKQVSPQSLVSINDAWEAHKIRNAIAHEGQNFVLTDREARRVVGLYENVFREYKYI